MKFRCSCGHIFEETKTIINGGGDRGENWEVCPICGDDDIEEVCECAECGCYVSDLFGELCRDCFDKAADVDTVKEYGADSRDTVEVNGLYGKAFTQSQIDSILARAFAELTAAQQRSAAVEMCEDDPQAFADWRRSA